MIKSKRVMAAIAASAVLGAFGLPAPVLADFDAPKKVDCTKSANKDKPACKPKHGDATDQEIYNAAYWMAHQGQYRQARQVLAMAANQNDPAILTAIGFVTRKLGDVDAALPYYGRALALNPDYVLAREYLGEAHLTRGDLASAQHELAEIEQRCGTQCTAYVHLAEHITSFKAAVPAKG